MAHLPCNGIPPMDIDTDRPVMVTGATGYVAGWLVQRLLEAGLTVHAAVRDPDSPDKLKHLQRIAAGKPGTIRYFRADLLEPGSYEDAMAGCAIVFHTASPFTVTVRDPQKELVDPALLGTRNVLETVNRTPSVRRVVLTSSCAAIYGDNADLAATPNGMFTEAIWNTSSSLAHQPYSYSKTVAEREAWQIARRQQRWDLVTINPSLVIGPGINPYATSESFEIVRQMGDGTMKAGVPDLGMGAVDVRDVADAHLRAAFLPSANGRYIVSAHDTNLPAMAATLLERYGADYPIPRRILPKWLVWLVGPLVNKSVTRRVIARNVGLRWRADNSRSRNELGIRYRPLAESMNDFFQQLVETGQLRR
ncbi:diaminohydroxyphosphoribosylaminopyrimidine deaminase [Burkholderia sp. MSMB2157WGS]|nr:diaminohydroxyphosphoribosylaminopyrimidine deaminase [Burkholderia sp. MSMB2157WGS]